MPSERYLKYVGQAKVSSLHIHVLRVTALPIVVSRDLRIWKSFWV